MSGIMDLFGGGTDEPEMPSIQAEQAKRTAEPIEQLSEEAKKSRRMAASMITKGWETPKLGAAGLLGA